MNMDKWINILTEREDTTRPLLWSWDMSGNILELSVPAGVKNEIDNYRHSVMQVGKIIQRIRNSYPESTEKPSVQLFPNLMDIGLVAVVRAPNTNNPKPNTLLINGEAKSFKELLEKGKRDFSLEAEEVVFSESDLVSLGIQPEKYRTIVLSSAVSNPFVWVRTGYFLELLRNFHTDKMMDKEFLSVEKINKSTKHLISSKLIKNTVPQALILIET